MADADRTEEGAAILFYDGHCLMCSSAIQWLMKRDTHQRLRFAALQDPDAQPLLTDAPPKVQTADSVVLYTDQQFYLYSDAVIQTLQLLGGIYRLSAAAYVIPKNWRDRIYRWVARNRTQWFGRSETCFFVPSEQRFRFLTDPTKDFSAGAAEEE
jgi:predicted DCC family thiol-disulfide oxidoreductase YuxK